MDKERYMIISFAELKGKRERVEGWRERSSALRNACRSSGSKRRLLGDQEGGGIGVPLGQDCPRPKLLKGMT